VNGAIQGDYLNLYLIVDKKWVLLFMAMEKVGVNSDEVDADRHARSEG
jgi:hypothetical protein